MKNAMQPSKFKNTRLDQHRVHAEEQILIDVALFSVPGPQVGVAARGKYYVLFGGLVRKKELKHRLDRVFRDVDQVFQVGVSDF